MVVGFYQSDCRQNVCTIQLVFDQKYYHISPFWALAFWKTQIKENLMKTWGKKCNIKKCDFSISLRKTRDKSSDISFQKIEFSIFLKFSFYMVLFMKKASESTFQYKKQLLDSTPKSSTCVPKQQIFFIAIKMQEINYLQQ